MSAQPDYENYVYPPPRIVPGFRLTQEQAERCTRQKIISRASDWAPQGSRMYVCKDVVDEKAGSIILTEETKELSEKGTGWIVAVGPEAGRVGYSGYNTASCGTILALDDNPENLLELHVGFSFFVGKAWRFSQFDDEYDSQIILLAPGDIWAVDMSEDPWAADNTFAEAYNMRMAHLALKSSREVEEREENMAQMREESIASSDAKYAG